MIAGLLNKEIGAELGITFEPSRLIGPGVMQKMGVISVAELVRLAQKAGITPAPHGPKGP